jgi:hypothetical protein
MSYWHHPLCAKRLECAQLAAAVARPATPESAGKLDALQTLRAGRTPGALVDLLGFCLSPGGGKGARGFLGAKRNTREPPQISNLMLRA